MPLETAGRDEPAGPSSSRTRIAELVRSTPPRELHRESRVIQGIELGRVCEVACRGYQVEPSELSRRGSRHEALAALAYLARELTLATHGELAQFLGVSRPDCVGGEPHAAGRDGFWLHRFLRQERINNAIVDSSSIEVNRRARRAKADGLDAISLVGLLVRHCEGETDVWSVVEVPDPADEDQRQLHRELDELRRERTAHSNRVRGLLATIGIKVTGQRALPCDLDLLRQWNGDPLPKYLKRRLAREFERMQLLDRQIRALEVEQAEQIQTDQTRHVEKVRMLMGLKGVGQMSATILVYEFFGWRRFANRRQVAALAGLTPTPYQSGESNAASRVLTDRRLLRPELAALLTKPPALNLS